MKAIADLRPVIRPDSRTAEERTSGLRTRRDRRRPTTILVCAAVAASLGSADHIRGDDVAARGLETARGVAAARVVDLDLRSLARSPSGRIEAPAVRDAKAGNDQPAATSEEPRDFLDPLVAAQQRASTKSIESSLTIDKNFAGVSYTGITPSDAIGDASHSHFIQMVNGVDGSVFAIFDKVTGEAVAGPSELDQLWGEEGACAEGWGHPVVVHDSLANRWLLSELGAGNHLCLYVSQTPNPVTGGWYAYDFELPQFPDFARIGVWSDAYYAATNEAAPAVYAFDRDAMMAGAPAAFLRFTVPSLSGFGFQGLTPADLDGVTPPPLGTGNLLLRHADGTAHGGFDRLEIFELRIDWGAPQNSSLSGPLQVPLASFDSSLCGLAARECLRQPGTDVALDPVREVVMWAVRYRKSDGHESLVGNFSVDTDSSDHAGIRWFELRRAGGAWSLHQEGTYSPDSQHRWIGSVAVDRDGNMALAFNLTDASTAYPSIRCVGREAADPAGVMTTPEVELQAGTSAQTVGLSPELWGAYNSLSVDPEDDCTFWLTAGYGDNGAWGTRVASIRFPSCDGVAPSLIFADGFESGDTSSWSTAVP